MRRHRIFIYSMCLLVFLHCFDWFLDLRTGLCSFCSIVLMALLAAELRARAPPTHTPTHPPAPPPPHRRDGGGAAARRLRDARERGGADGPGAPPSLPCSAPPPPALSMVFVAAPAARRRRPPQPPNPPPTPTRTCHSWCALSTCTATTTRRGRQCCAPCTSSEARAGRAARGQAARRAAP